MVAKNNLTEAPGTDFYGSFYPGSDFNASSDDSAPGFTRAGIRPLPSSIRGGRLPPGRRRCRGAQLRAGSSHDPGSPSPTTWTAQAALGGWDIGADEAASGSDSVPPVRFNGAPSGELPSTTTQITLTLSTAEAADCRYATNEGVAYSDMPNPFADNRRPHPRPAYQRAAGRAELHLLRQMPG